MDANEIKVATQYLNELKGSNLVSVGRCIYFRWQFQYYQKHKDIG